MDCAADRARRREQRSPLNALVEFDLRFRLGEWIVAEIDRDRIVLPRRWVSCVGAANDQTRMVWAGAQAEQESAAPGRAEAITGGHVGSPMCLRIARTEGVSMTSLERVGVLEMLAEEVIGLTGGDLALTAMAIIWVSAVFSAIVDNIPFVATMIPVIKSMAPTFGGAENLMPLWWSLALGACLGGNGSLVGASANLIVAGYAERAGHRMEFLKFMALAFPLMLVSIVIASIYVYFRFL